MDMLKDIITRTEKEYVTQHLEEFMPVESKEITQEKELKIEPIDKEGRFVTFNGHRYHKYRGYYERRVALHVDVYEKAHGIIIPEGYHVHHKDLNKLNNNLDNLELMTCNDHMKLHTMLTRKERTYFCSYCGKQFSSRTTRVTDKHHYCSEACRSKYSQEHRPVTERKCIICGKMFVKPKNSTAQTCSTNCTNLLMSKRRMEQLERQKKQDK